MEINYICPEPKVVKLERQDRGFMLEDNFARYPRATFHVTPECPARCRKIIQLAVNNGWLKPVSYIYSHEQTFNLLKE